MKIKKALRLVKESLKDTTSRHKPQASPHESFGLIWEELEEFWELVRLKKSQRSKKLMRAELIQVASTALKAAIDIT